MMRQAAGGACLLLVAACLAGSVLAQEDPSAFAGGYGQPLLDDADRLGIDTQRLVSTPTALRATDGSVLAVFDAPRPYTAAEQRAVHGFVEAGGHLLVADARGHGTQLSAAAGLTFERVRLHEPSGVASASLGGQTLYLTTHNASAVKVAPGTEATIIIASSADAQLDRDGDQITSRSDPIGPFPVLVSAPLGKGTVWVLALPDLFDPVHADAADHAAVRKAMLRQMAAETLIVDESRWATDDPLVTAAGRIVQAAAQPPWMVLALAAAALAAGLSLFPHQGVSWQPHRFIPDVFLRRGAHTDADRPTTGWTARGKTVATLGPAMAVAGLSTGNPQLAWAGAVCIAAVAVALLQRAPKGRAERTMRSSRLQERAAVPVTVKAVFSGSVANVKVREMLHPTMAVAQGTAWGIPTGPHVTMEYHVRPSRLGSFEIGPFEAVGEDSLGLRIRTTPLLAADPIKVTPLLQDARRTPFSSRVPQILLGGHLVQRAGSGSEFLSLRDYQSGDSLRMVNWKASARSKGLVVNQRVHESPTQLTVLLDVRAISDVGPANTTPFVLGARAAASITAGAMQSRDMVRVFLYGDGVREVAGRGPELQHRFLEALAEMRPDGNTDLQAAVDAAQGTLRPGRPVVVVTGAEDDASAEEALHRLRRRGLRPFLVSPPVSPEPGGAQAAAHQGLVKRLRSAGFPVYEVADGVRLEDMFRIQGAA